MADSSLSKTTQPLCACVESDERPEQTLQVSDLVREAYIRPGYVARLNCQHRHGFFAVSATLMRMDTGGSRAQAEMLALDDALHALARVAPGKARDVELCFSGGGLEVKETAEIACISSDAVMRDWKVAKARLLKEPTAV